MEFNAENIRGRRAAVLGAGKSGRAAALLLHKRGVGVFVSDRTVSDELRAGCEIFEQTGIEYELGGHSDDLLRGKDFLVVSPGISMDNSVVVRAVETGVPVYGELEVSWWFCRNPVIAVTGTNGKTTVITMLESIFTAAHKPVRTAGNIGRAFGDEVGGIPRGGTVLLEVSSYQLETIKTFQPETAVVLNISPDHLRRHKTMAEYTRCKMRIAENQTGDDVLILNRSDSFLSSTDTPGTGVTAWFDGSGTVHNGAGVLEGVLSFFDNGTAEKVIHRGDLPVPGRHNRDNALAAIAAAGCAGIDPESMRSGLKTFRGLEHRLEFAASVDGVTFINDSKATNIDAMKAALVSFCSPVVLIAGGEDKGSDLSLAENVMRNHVKTAIFLGEAAGRMRDAWGEIVNDFEMADEFGDAVRRAFNKAAPGDTVLLSPGCASFDMFSSFEERGTAFKEIALSLERTR